MTHQFQADKDGPDYCKCGLHKSHAEHGLSERERYYRECAAIMCSLCNGGGRPEWRIVFGGYCHIWKHGNGHSLCSAGPIWRCLDTQVDDAARAAVDGKC